MEGVFKHIDWLRFSGESCPFLTHTPVVVKENINVNVTPCWRTSNNLLHICIAVCPCRADMQRCYQKHMQLGTLFTWAEVIVIQVACKKHEHDILTILKWYIASNFQWIDLFYLETRLCSEKEFPKKVRRIGWGEVISWRLFDQQNYSEIKYKEEESIHTIKAARGSMSQLV